MFKSLVSVSPGGGRMVSHFCCKFTLHLLYYFGSILNLLIRSEHQIWQWVDNKGSVPEIIKKSCSTQLSMKFFLLTNVKMPTIGGILTFTMSRKDSILGLSVPENAEFIYSYL